MSERIMVVARWNGKDGACPRCGRSHVHHHEIGTSDPLAALAHIHERAPFACCNRAPGKAHHRACPVALALDLPRRGIGSALVAQGDR